MYRYRYKNGKWSTSLKLGARRKKNRGNNLREWKKKMAAANAALANRGASTSSNTEESADKNSVESQEIITPDLEMRSYGDGPSSSLMSTSGIVVKQEIIETEEDCNLFENSSFNSSFESHSDRQTPSTSNTIQSETSNSGAIPVGLTIAGALASTVDLSIVKIEPDSSTRDLNSGWGAPLSLSKPPSSSNVTSYDVSSREKSLESGITHHSVDSPIPSVLNTTKGLSNTVPIPSGASSCTESQSLPQVLNRSSMPITDNNKPVQFSVPSNLNPLHPYRDKFDAYGEFIASKLRKLDLKSCTFIQTALSDLIFKAELGMFADKSSDKDSFSTGSNINIQRDIDTIPHSQSETTCNSSGKENVQPTDPHLSPDMNITDSESLPGNAPNEPKVATHIPNPSVPNITSTENSGRNVPRVTSCINPSPSPVLNVTTSENPSVNNPNLPQNRIPFHIAAPSVPPVLIPSNSSNNVPIYPKVPFHMRPRDEFDAFGEFVATKLRTLDPRSCAFLQTAIADLIFEAELGRFLSEEERSIFVNKTNEIIRNLPSIHVSDSNSLANVISNIPRYATPPQRNFAPVGFHTDQAPLEVIPTSHTAPQ